LPLAPKLGRDASPHWQLGNTAGGKDRRELGGHEQQVAALNIDLQSNEGLSAFAGSLLADLEILM
jgi:hypothetical protein